MDLLRIANKFEHLIAQEEGPDTAIIGPPSESVRPGWLDYPPSERLKQEQLAQEREQYIKKRRWEIAHGVMPINWLPSAQKEKALQWQEDRDEAQYNLAQQKKQWQEESKARELPRYTLEEDEQTPLALYSREILAPETGVPPLDATINAILVSISWMDQMNLKKSRESLTQAIDIVYEFGKEYARAAGAR